MKKERTNSRWGIKVVSMAVIMTLIINAPLIHKTVIKKTEAQTISAETEWNIKCLNAEKSYEESKNLKKIKVVVLDSGLDYDRDLPAVKKKDFLGQGELHPLYQDMTGHGTSVASLICARKNEDRITGIAANVELYVARIFDYGNDAPVERVVRAINWAVDEKVNIIHMSFGTKEYSGALEDAIERAYQAGILIIAAAGNSGHAPEDESTIEYPAAFDNVISVGATDKYNNMTQSSSTGDEMDVVAPGDCVLTDGAFGGVAVDDGTSISAAQVTGVAAVLWGKHPEKTNEFIKNLLVGSANKEAVNSEFCGNGLVDYEQADKNYDQMNRNYQEYKKDGVSEQKAIEKAEENLPENTKTVKTHGEVNYVNASWSGKNHKAIVENANGENNKYLDNASIDYVKAGAVHSDRFKEMSGMANNPYFHGRGDYLANTQYLYCLAINYKKKTEENNDVPYPTTKQLGFKNYTKEVKIKKKKGKKGKQKTKQVTVNPVQALEKKLKSNNFLDAYFKSVVDGGYFTKDINSQEDKPQMQQSNSAKGYILLGAAIHNLTDVFSHNVRKQLPKKYGGLWCPTVHKKKKTGMAWDTNSGDKKRGEAEQKYLKYLLDNFAIADKRAETEETSTTDQANSTSPANNAGQTNSTSPANNAGQTNNTSPANNTGQTNSTSPANNTSSTNSTGQAKKKVKKVNQESMYKLAEKAGECVLAAFSSEESSGEGSKKTWYSLLKQELKQVKNSKLKLRDINGQWRILTGKQGTFKGLTEGKNPKQKKVGLKYSIISSDNKRRIQILPKHAYGYSIYINKKLIKSNKEGIMAVKPSKLKKNKINIMSYRGFKRKSHTFNVKFKIKYSCKGMKNVRIKKGKKNTVQIAQIGNDITFTPRNNIFEVKKGKKKFKGWHRKRGKKDKSLSVDIKANKKKEKFPKNAGNEITLYPVFK